MANMERIRILFAAVFVTSVAAACGPLGAQSAAVSGTPQIETEAAREPGPQQPLVPGAATSERAHSIELRSSEQMSPADRNLVAQAQPAIAERASFAGMEFDRGKWNFQQLMCPVLPNHVLLRFTRDGGGGDVSVFSASIPRGATGRVRVIPIQRRGYSLFSPAPVNALTIYAFNRIQGEEPAEPAPDLLATGLCYAALAGASPKVAPLDAGQSSSEALTISDHLGATIVFVNAAEAPRPMRWTMTFDGAGRLLGVAQESALPAKERPVEPAVAEAKGKPLPEADVDLKGKPVPADDGRYRFKPVPADDGRYSSKTVPGDDGRYRSKPIPQGSKSQRIKVIGQTGDAPPASVQ